MPLYARILKSEIKNNSIEAANEKTKKFNELLDSNKELDNKFKNYIKKELTKWIKENKERIIEEYKDLYNEISVEGSYLDFRQTNTMPKSITDYLWILSDAGAKTFNNGVITPHPSIEYLNSPQKVLQKYGKLLYVDVSIAASDSQGQKYSRLKRYYWSEDDQVWLAMEVVSLRAKDRKADEFF